MEETGQYVLEDALSVKQTLWFPLDAEDQGWQILSTPPCDTKWISSEVGYITPDINTPLL